MAEKLRQVGKYWGGSHSEFKGYGDIDSGELRKFLGTHPAIMDNWISSESETHFLVNSSYKPTMRDLRNRFRFWLEETFEIEISKKHFRPLD